MDNFIEEVEEELKRERYMDLWRRYGRFVVAAVILVVILVAGAVGWRQYQQNQRIEAGLAFMDARALAEQGKREEALAAFKKLADDGAAGYRELARFQQAALLSRQGNEAAAAGVYDSIARDSGADRLFRDLALVLYAYSVADRAEPKALIDRLEPLTEDSSPWRFSALEITALLQRRRGDTNAAKDIYRKLADDEKAPPKLRARAAEFLAVIGD
ncbi:MAG TPA: tetratricopeptide repeat protein [Alphaproteobacteria bacterium]|nr:tetratricopeptide repeat protein [Alphaproteobacteria bacterium]